MERFAFHIIFACMLGMCGGEEDSKQPQCICKPTMKLEWQPSTPMNICNNATYDWLLNTVLAEVTKQNELTAAATREAELLSQTLSEKEVKIAEMAARMAENDKETIKTKNALAAMTEENKRLQAELEETTEAIADQIKAAPKPKDCADVQRYGFHYSGIYNIYPSYTQTELEVFCDLNTDGGGWLVFQRRQDGSQRFDNNWNEYKDGFGRLAKEFWLGNEKLYQLLKQRHYQLRVDLTTYDGATYYASYSQFAMDSEAKMYTLHVNGYHGTAGDALTHHDNSPFSTVDQDNDKSRSGNCAKLFGGGGWWYLRCYDSNLNGLYTNQHSQEAVVWYQLHHNHESLRHVEMKIRPASFNSHHL